MGENREIERRSSYMQDLEVITSRQADWMTDKITRNPSEAEIFRDSLSLKVVNNRFERFPAEIESDKIGSRYTLLYDRPTIDKLVDRFGSSYQLTEGELSELYVGTAIASRLLKNEIQDTNIKMMKRMMTILTNKDVIAKEVQANQVLSERQRINIVQGIMQSEEGRIGNINVLRFAFGMVYWRAGEITNAEGSGLRQTPVMHQFRQGLVETLRYRPLYLQLGKFFEQSEDEFGRKFVIDGELVGEKVFADAAGEFEMAACFPMQWQELHAILKIIQ